MNLNEIRSLSQIKEIGCDDILCCVLGLRRLEADIFWILSKEECTILDISKEIKRDRSIVQRAVSNLISYGLASRRRERVRRGRKYIYTAVEPEKVRARLLNELDQMHAAIRSRILKL